MTNNAKPTLSDWNWLVLMLNQALVGAITPNMRQVDLVYNNQEWHCVFYLSHSKDNDIDAIQDILEDFQVFVYDVWDKLTLPCRGPIKSEVHIMTNEIPTNSTSRIVFKRKE